MGIALSTYTNGRDNNYNLIRFIAAFLVLYSHSYPLVLGIDAVQPLVNLVGRKLGSIAVDAFFITSGFLITSSYFLRNNILHFAWARVLRIFPALIVAVLFCVFIVGLGFTALPSWEFLSDYQTFKFLVKNSTLFLGIEHNLPGVFDTNPLKSVNGSLWTLPYEVKMYATIGTILFGLGYLQKRLGYGSPKKLLLAITFVVVALTLVNHFYQFAPGTAGAFIHLFCMFLMGATCYVWRDHIHLSSGYFALALLAFFIASYNFDLFFVLYVVLFPYMLLYIAYVPSGGIRKFNRVGDYSYGMYIYAFPVQQSIAALYSDGISVAGMAAGSFGATFLLSFLSWHIIEKRCLKMKNIRLFRQGKFAEK